MTAIRIAKIMRGLCFLTLLAAIVLALTAASSRPHSLAVPILLSLAVVNFMLLLASGAIINAEQEREHNRLAARIQKAVGSGVTAQKFTRSPL